MRLPEDKIKEAILHRDTEIRRRAVRYFTTSFSADRSIMPLVIRAVETFGREDAYHLIGPSRDLPQTEDTVDWIINELNDSQSDEYESYTYNLSAVLAQADIALLLPNESAILGSSHFFSRSRESFAERLQMLSWDQAACWRALEVFCEEGKDEQYIGDVNLGYANRIVEALSRYGDKCQERIHEVLNRKIEDYHHNPMKWMEPLMVRLAGEIQLDSAVPLLIAKLAEDGGDLLNEEWARALSRIGTPTVVNAISQVYAKSSYHFRLYAGDPLENIHSDLAVEACLSLLRQEKDPDIRTNLACALLSHFSPEGVEEARQLLLGPTLGFESRGLRNHLVETCTIMGERFPEYDEWRAAQRTQSEEHRRRMKEMKDDPASLTRFASDRLEREPLSSRLPILNLPATSQNQPRVGRNAPCPCGSGKKFKKCCMNNPS